MKARRREARFLERKSVVIKRDICLLSWKAGKDASDFQAKDKQFEKVKNVKFIQVRKKIKSFFFFQFHD